MEWSKGREGKEERRKEHVQHEPQILCRYGFRGSDARLAQRDARTREIGEDRGLKPSLLF